MMEPRLMPFSVIKSDKLNSLPMNSLLCTLYIVQRPNRVYTHYTLFHVLKSSKALLPSMCAHIELEHNLNATSVLALELCFFHLPRLNRCSDLPNAVAAAAVTTMAVGDGVGEHFMHFARPCIYLRLHLNLKCMGNFHTQSAFQWLIIFCL